MERGSDRPSRNPGDRPSGSLTREEKETDERKPPARRRSLTDNNEDSLSEIPGKATVEKRAASAISEPAPKKRKKKRKRPSDKPKHPMTAYNYFFREQRQQLLAERESAAVPGTAEATAARSHPTSGKEMFAFMGKTVSERWKAISPQAAEKYRLLAEADMERYRREMQSYQARKAAEEYLDGGGGGGAALLSSSSSTVPAADIGSSHGSSTQPASSSAAPSAAARPTATGSSLIHGGLLSNPSGHGFPVPAAPTAQPPPGIAAPLVRGAVLNSSNNTVVSNLTGANHDSGTNNHFSLDSSSNNNNNNTNNLNNGSIQQAMTAARAPGNVGNLISNRVGLGHLLESADLLSRAQGSASNTTNPQELAAVAGNPTAASEPNSLDAQAQAAQLLQAAHLAAQIPTLPSLLTSVPNLDAQAEQLQNAILAAQLQRALAGAQGAPAMPPPPVPQLPAVMPQAPGPQTPFEGALVGLLNQAVTMQQQQLQSAQLIHQQSEALRALQRQLIQQVSSASASAPALQARQGPAPSFEALPQPPPNQVEHQESEQPADSEEDEKEDS